MCLSTCLTKQENYVATMKTDFSEYCYFQRYFKDPKLQKNVIVFFFFTHLHFII